jgi:hypothetical protein
MGSQEMEVSWAGRDVRNGTWEKAFVEDGGIIERNFTYVLTD